MKWVTLWIRWKNIGPLWGSSNIFWNFIMDLFSNYGNTQYIIYFQSFDPLQYPNIHILYSHVCSYEYVYSFMTHGWKCVMHAIKIVILSNIFSFFFSNDLQLIKNLIFFFATSPPPPPTRMVPLENKENLRNRNINDLDLYCSN